MINRDVGPLLNLTRTREPVVHGKLFSGRAADPNSAALELHCRSVSDPTLSPLDSDERILVESACQGHALSDSLNSKKRQENQGFPANP